MPIDCPAHRWQVLTDCVAAVAPGHRMSLRIGNMRLAQQLLEGALIDSSTARQSHAPLIM